MAKKKLKVIEVEGVRGYVDKNNVAWLNAEDVARGLGFVETKNGIEYVRWRTINGYLHDFGFSQDVAKEMEAGYYIPENMFYRLAMKASNEAAQNFQAKIADEVMPSIRKNGFYSIYNKELNSLQREQANLAGERSRLECERIQLEDTLDRLNSELENRKIERAKLLRELALATNNNDLRDDLIRSAASLITDENFIIRRHNDL